ncbi:MAG: nucleoside monophosphate kinase [Candidatus Vogelbacteria bacterium]|nr:nucleoside monophosphate kinase [Candidatus Vogelbacteria bacterium]
MASFGFPVFKTRTGGKEKFNLEDPKGRKQYFELKAGKEIKDIRNCLKKNSFVAFMMGKKNSGKGTHTKLFAEQIGADKVFHLSIGDVIRSAHKEVSTSKGRKAMASWLKDNFRNVMTPEEAIAAIEGRSTSSLISTELTLALVERAISTAGKKKAVFVDGFPRGLDQVSYALYFRHIMGYREDPDFFVFMDVPSSIIAARQAGRVVCPICHVPRHPKLLRTKDVGYDASKKEFYLICDTPDCKGARMVKKEGDNLKANELETRLRADETIMRKLLELKGIGKVHIRNSVPVREARSKVDMYEVTPSYEYSLDNKGKVVVNETPWVVEDDDGVDSYSLLPVAPVLSMIKQIHKVLKL